MEPRSLRTRGLRQRPTQAVLALRTRTAAKPAETAQSATISGMADGWLEAPDGREVRRYHRDPESPGRNPTIWIDHGLPVPGEPALLKRRRRVPRDAALIEWMGLQKAGWRKVPAQW
jgi:hypothetical protein